MVEYNNSVCLVIILVGLKLYNKGRKCTHIKTEHTLLALLYNSNYKNTDIHRVDMNRKTQMTGGT